jgi:HD-like signal output (HDOD) protein
VIEGQYPLDGLPIFPTTATALLPRLNEPEVSLERIGPLVAQDPALAAEVIKLANDGLPKRLLKPVTNLDQALDALDIEPLRATLLKALLRPSIPIKPIFYSLVGRPLWDHARDCATACQALAHGNQVEPADGYLLGLVHDTGKLVIFKLLCSALRATSATVSPRAGIVARMVQGYADELSHCLARHWNFPSSFLDAIEEQASVAPGSMSPLGRTLFQGNLIAEAYVVMQRHRFPRSHLDEALRRFDLSLNLVYSIFPAAPRPATR